MAPHSGQRTSANHLQTVGEYSLSDANGNKVSLTDLISGHVSEVQIMHSQ